MEFKKQLEYQADPNKFDLRTHVWDSQGRLVKKNLYRAFLVNGSKYYERPVNSGNLWYENNQPAGRVELTFNEKGHIVKKEFNFEAQHKEYTPPLTGNEKIHYELEQERIRNAELQKELSQIKAEIEKREAKPSGLSKAVEAEKDKEVLKVKEPAPRTPILKKPTREVE